MTNIFTTEQELEVVEKTIYVVSASSGGNLAGDYVIIKINEKVIELQPNENEKYRGLHVVIINSESGGIASAQVFDTHESSLAFEEFIKIKIPQGFIVVAACKDECAKKLSKKARDWFVQMGSIQINKLLQGQSFAFIGYMGRQVANERRSKKRTDPVTVTQVCNVNKDFEAPAYNYGNPDPSGDVPSEEETDTEELAERKKQQEL